MKSINPLLPLVVLFAFLFLGCQKQELKWSSDWVVPLADGEIKMSDLLDEKFLQVNGQGWYDLVFDTTLDFGVFIADHSGYHGAIGLSSSRFG